MSDQIMPPPDEPDGPGRPPADSAYDPETFRSQVWEYLTPIWDKFDKVVHPPPTGLRRLFFWVSVAIVTILFIGSVMVTSPFLYEWWGCTIAAHIKPYLSRDAAKQICDWMAMLSQVIIFASIGGVVFTESLARKLNRIMNDFQKATIESLTSKNEERAAAFRNSIRNVESAFETKGNYRKKVGAALEFMTNSYFDATAIPQRYLVFAARGIVFNFPGGLYGFLGFLFLSVQIIAISIKISLDYLPPTCGW